MATRHGTGRNPAEVAQAMGINAEGAAILVNGRPAGMDTELRANDTVFFAKDGQQDGGRA